MSILSDLCNCAKELMYILSELRNYMQEVTYILLELCNGLNRIMCLFLELCNCINVEASNPCMVYSFFQRGTMMVNIEQVQL